MIDLLSIHIPHGILDRVPHEKAYEKKVVPVGVFNKILYLAVDDPATFSEQHHFAFATRLNIKTVFSPLHEIITFIDTKWAGVSSDFWAG